MSSAQPLSGSRFALKIHRAPASSSPWFLEETLVAQVGGSDVDEVRRRLEHQRTDAQLPVAEHALAVDRDAAPHLRPRQEVVVEVRVEDALPHVVLDVGERGTRRRRRPAPARGRFARRAPGAPRSVLRRSRPSRPGRPASPRTDATRVDPRCGAEPRDVAGQTSGLASVGAHRPDVEEAVLSEAIEGRRGHGPSPSRRAPVVGELGDHDPRRRRRRTTRRLPTGSRGWSDSPRSTREPPSSPPTRTFVSGEIGRARSDRGVSGPSWRGSTLGW